MGLIKRSKLVAVLACALVGSVLAPAASAMPATPLEGLPETRSACRSASGSVLMLHSFHIEAEAKSKVVRRGKVFTIDMRVTRPAHEDPADLGIEYEPPMSTPEKDVTVGVSIYTGEHTYFWAMGITDENGEETLKVRVPRNAEPGRAYAAFSAQKWLKQDCPDILEYGFREYMNFVTVVP